MSRAASGGREEILARLEELVRIETPSGDPAAIARAVDWLAGKWEPLGAHLTRLDSPAGPQLIADLPGAGAPVLLIGHADTVWPAGTLAGALPWSRAHGVIRGPGVYDMKAGLIVIDHLLRTLASASEPHPPIRVFVAADEETGSVHARTALAAATGGVRAAIGFESPHPDGALKAGRLGSVRARLSVTGRSAHAALDPASGVSATEELLDALQAVRGLVAAAPAHPALRTPLYNLGGLQSAGSANVIPDKAGALLGFRFADDAQEQHTLDGIRRLGPQRPGAAIHLEILSRRPPWDPRPEDTRLAALVPGDGTSARAAAGAADTNLLAAAPFPVVDGFGPRGGGAHALTEHIIEESLWQRCDQLVDVIRALASVGADD